MPAFANTKPLRWLLLHFNEKALEKFPGTSPSGWSKFLSAFYSTYQVAHGQHVPVGIITDAQIYEGFFQDASILFLPNTETISPELMVKIREFEKAGGTVISQAPEWNWHLGGDYFQHACQSFKILLDSVAERPVMQSMGGSSFFYSNYFVKNQADTTKYLASYSNTLNWIDKGAVIQSEDAARSCDVKQPKPVNGITLKVNRRDSPLSVIDVIAGTKIPYKMAGGMLIVEVPEFEDAALIELTYTSTRENP